VCDWQWMFQIFGGRRWYNPWNWFKD